MVQTASSSSQSKLRARTRKFDPSRTYIKSQKPFKLEKPRLQWADYTSVRQYVISRPPHHNIPLSSSESQDYVIVNDGTIDRDFTVGTSGDSLTTSENVVNVESLERCFNEKIDREMSNIVDKVGDRNQNTFLTAIDSIVALRIGLAIRSISASSGRDEISVTANSERGEHVGITVSFENASENKNVLHISNVNDETRNNIPGEVSELSVPETRFDRQPHTHHNYA